MLGADDRVAPGQIRAELGFREATRDDEAWLVAWLADELAPVERSNERLVEALRARCRQERMEPTGWTGRSPLPGRPLPRALCERTVQRLPAAVTDRLERLVEPSQGWRGALGDIKVGGGRPGLETLLAEVRRLERVRAIGLPADLFGGCRTRSWPRGGPGPPRSTRRTCAAIPGRCG